MDMIDTFQKSIAGPVLDFAARNPALLIGVLGLLVIAYFVSGVHTTVVLPLFDDGSKSDAADGDGGDGGGGDGGGGGD